MVRRIRMGLVLFAVAILLGQHEQAVAQQIQTFAGGETDEVQALAYSPDGKLLAGGGFERDVVRLWDAQTGELLRKLSGARLIGVRQLAFSSDSKTVAAAGGFANNVYLWDTTTGRLKQTLSHSGLVSSVAFSPDGKTLVSMAYEGFPEKGKAVCEVRLWDLPSGKERARLLREQGCPDGVAFSADGKTLAIALVPEYGAGPNSFFGVVLWDMQAGQEKRRLPWDGASCSSPVFSPDGKILATGGGYGIGTDTGTRSVGQITMWEIDSGKVLRKLTGQDNGTYQSIAFSPDGKTLASGSRGPIKEYKGAKNRVSETQLWDTATGHPHVKPCRSFLLYRVSPDLRVFPARHLVKSCLPKQ